MKLPIAPPKHSRHKARTCSRYRTVGRFTHTDIAGLNRLRFTGRINHHKLSAGSYRLRAIARVNTKASAPSTAAFTVEHQPER